MATGLRTVRGVIDGLIDHRREIVIGHKVSQYGGPAMPYGTNPFLERDLEPIGGGFYQTPLEPVDPWDCRNYPNSPACGGTGLSPFAAPSLVGGVPVDTFWGHEDEQTGEQVYTREPNRGVDDTPYFSVCVELWPSVGFVGLPPYTLCYSNAPEPPPEDEPPDPSYASRSSPSIDPNSRYRECYYNVHWESTEWRYDNGQFIEYPSGGAAIVLGPVVPAGVETTTFADREYYKVFYRVGPNMFFNSQTRLFFDTNVSTRQYPFTHPVWQTYVTGPGTPWPGLDIVENPPENPPNTYVPGKGLKLPTPRIIYIQRHPTFGCPTEIDRRIPPEPPRRDDVDCDCQEIEELLRLIAKRVNGDHRENQGDFPVKVPALLIEGTGDDEIEIHSIPQMIHWFIQQFDALLGQFPVEVKIDEPDEQEREVKFQNVSEFLAEIYGLLVTTAMDTDTNQNFLARLSAETIATRNAAIIAQDLAFANNEFLGAKIRKKKREVKSAFNIKERDDVRKFLNEGKYDLPSYENSDTKTVLEYLHNLSFAAGIIKSVFLRTKVQGFTTEGAISLISEIARGQGGNAEEEWNEFVRSVENPTGRANNSHLEHDIDEIDDDENDSQVIRRT